MATKMQIVLEFSQMSSICSIKNMIVGYIQIDLVFSLFSDMRHISYNKKLIIRKLQNYDYVINDIKAT